MSFSNFIAITHSLDTPSIKYTSPFIFLYVFVSESYPVKIASPNFSEILLLSTLVVLLKYLLLLNSISSYCLLIGFSFQCCSVAILSLYFKSEETSFNIHCLSFSLVSIGFLCSLRLKPTIVISTIHIGIKAYPILIFS